MKTALTPPERIERMRSNALRFRGPRLQQSFQQDGHISICGFGPSLADTWEKIRGRVMTTSGAHDYMIGRGLIPAYHVETDPRVHKVEFVRHSHPDVTYLINSQCHPLMFEALEDREVVMWHGFTDDDAKNQVLAIEAIDPGTRFLAGGTNVGMRAIVVARELGFTQFDLHGFDCCYDGERQWAGEHFTARHHTVRVEVEGRVFDTSDLMMQSTDDFFNLLRMMPGCRFVVHGDGLLEERLKLYVRDPQKALSRAWWQPVNFTVSAA